MISDIQTKSGWIIVYGSNGKEIKRMGDSGKEVGGAAGNTFTVKSSDWIITYDKNCK